VGNEKKRLLDGRIQMLPMWMMFRDFLVFWAWACFVKLQLDCGVGASREEWGHMSAFAHVRDRTSPLGSVRHSMGCHGVSDTTDVGPK